MIKANELRIGNWLKCKNDYVQLESISEDGKLNIAFYGDCAEWEYDLELDINGIELSEDLLLKSGFTTFIYGANAPGHTGYENYWLTGFLNLDNCFCLIGHRGNHQNIKYFHQLQNLFNILTGKELPTPNF